MPEIGWRPFRRSWIGAILVGFVLALIVLGCQSKPKSTPTTEPTRESTPTRTTDKPQGETPVAIAPAGDGSPTPQAAGGAQATPTANESPTPVVSPTPQALTATPTPANCLNQAVFTADVTIPDGTVLRPNEEFIKTWKVRNTGTCDWGEGYTMAFSGGDIMNGALNQAISQPIRAGEYGEVSVKLTAPTRGGRQTGYWTFQDPAGRRFGLGITSLDMLWVQINVTFLDEAGNPGFVPISFQPTPVAETGPNGESMDEDGSAGQSSPPEENGDGGSGNGGDGSGGGQLGNCKYTENPGYASTILRLINQARQQNGLQPLFQQDQLTAAAVAHSADMGCNRYVDHNGSDGSTWYDRVRLQGYAAPTSARENIYVGDPAFGGDANGAFNWWMGSQVHRDNILFANVTECGIGYVYVPGSPYGGYYTLVFGKR